MTKKSGTESVIERIMNLVRALSEAAVFPALDASEEQLLSQLAVAWDNGEYFIAPEASLLPGHNSAHSMRSRLQSLQSKGVIRFVPDKDDQRISYVVQTSLTTEHFAKPKQRIVTTPDNSC